MKKPIPETNKSSIDAIESGYLVAYNILNNTKTPYPNVTLNELLSKQAEISPNNIALEFHDVKITYFDLHKKVNQLAHYLKAQGVVSGDFIAVSIPRSPELLYTLLAIVQCGAAYLPLDPEYPIERLNFMIEDSAAKILITSNAVAESAPNCTLTLLIEDAMKSLNLYSTAPLSSNVSPNDNVYILYTSGSTGKPKGVPITHKNLVNFLCSMALEPGINENDRLLSITTISFDIASLELYLPLIKGATLILADQEIARDGLLLLELIKKANISFLQATPTTWSMLLDSGWSKPLPLKVLCGGEAMSIDLAKQLTAKCYTLWNMYGPTETTIWSSLKQIKADDALITIGKPIANTQLYIIDDQGQLVAPGEIGEIAIGGDGVAKGYWNRPELTAEKFTNNRFSVDKNDRLYHTGDLGKILPNDEIECLGRLDQQVKIRGFRIEPGEVEQLLLSLEGIKHAVVLANDIFLIAHIVPNSSIESAKILIPSWRKSLVSQLPPHFVPHYINLLEKLPTTLNGKIDRKTLLEYEFFTESTEEYTAPRTNTEKVVAEIWQETLKKEHIDIFSNFFEIGGHSIVAVRVMNKIRQQTGKQFPISALFEYSTVEKFAKLLDEGKEISADCIVPIKPSGNKVPLFMVHGVGLDVLYFANTSKHLDEEQPFYGLQGVGANGFENWYTSIEDMAAQYIQAITKVNPNGPYAIAGYCVGGIVAFEITKQLQQQGKEVSLTAVLDSYADSSYYCKSYRQKKLIKYYYLTRKRLTYLIEMLTSWKAFKKRFNAKKEYLLKKHYDDNNTMSEQDQLGMERFTKATGMMHSILNKYHLKPHSIKVDVLRSKDNESLLLAPKHLGWRKAAQKGVTIHHIPASDFDMRTAPHDKILARMLQDILDERHAKI